MMAARRRGLGGTRPLGEKKQKKKGKKKKERERASGPVASLVIFPAMDRACAALYRHNVSRLPTPLSSVSAVRGVWAHERRDNEKRAQTSFASVLFFDAGARTQPSLSQPRGARRT